ncbi:hypothetical protein [Tumebacillus flagellatus]|uniref:Uncharacterized protein n=1 Tax=Tumebacillus flagellatus TaxID=1157490 RepID=A0A074LX60_9BACL|nr:hypothetical protein [Tumebacillus flagellatus]KEO84628.1 hypothetical protein EL26_03685 [Tumebacillus flagellatus]
MATLLQYKWVILGVLEILAWTTTFLMLYARYGLRSNLWFKIFSVAFALTGVIPQVAVGILNFIANRELDLFTLILVLLILYGATLGKKQVRQLDAWAKNKFNKKNASLS